MGILKDSIIGTVRQPGEWSVFHNPPVNTAAMVQQPATAGVRHIVCSLSLCIANESTAKSALAAFQLMFGATVARIWRIIVPAGDTRTVDLSGLHLQGNVGESVTLQSTAAAGIDTYETVNMSGYSITEPAGFERSLTP
jgi:hypothetical protein